MKFLSKFRCIQNFSKINTNFLRNIKRFQFLFFNGNGNLVLIIDLFFKIDTILSGYILFLSYLYKF